MSTVNMSLPLPLLYGLNCFQGDTVLPYVTPFVKTDDVWQTGPGAGQHPIRPQPDTKAPPQPLGDTDTNTTLIVGFWYFACPCHWPCLCPLLFSLPSLSATWSLAVRWEKVMSSQTCREMQKSFLCLNNVEGYRDISFLISQCISMVKSWIDIICQR